jgi:glycosyltransferase involved in cell wall biosynthesis
MARLIHLAAYPNTHAGSFIPFVRAVLATAAGRGWETAAVFPPEVEESEWRGDLEALGTKLYFVPPARRAATGWLRGALRAAPGPVVVHTHFTRYDLGAAIAARGVADAHVYWHVHTVLSEAARARLANRLKFSLLGPGLDGIFTPAADVAAELVRRGAPAAKVEVLPNAIETARFPLSASGVKAAARRELELPAEAEVLLHFGRDWRIKGGALFLDALARLVAEGRPAWGLINQGGEAAAAAAAARDLGARVRVVGVRAQPADLFHAADLLVSSSIGETMPFVVTEGLSSGLPVVATELAGHRYMAARVDNCVTVPSDPAALAAAAARFLDRDPTEAAAAGRRANEWIRENLDVAEVAELLVDRYARDLGVVTSAGVRAR